MPAKFKSGAADWAHARKAESTYGTQLRRIARHIGHIIKGFDLNDPLDAMLLQEALKRYAFILSPWARAAARLMVSEVAARSERPWRKVSAEMGRAFKQTITDPTDIGQRYRALMDEQVGLITSIPLDAAQRVHHLVTQGVIEGKRFSDIIPEIERGGEVAISRATLIARTETGRVVTNLTRARAESIGSTSYVWRTMNDAAVRPSHRAMEGQPVPWEQPPTLDGLRGHAGTVPNCRCYAEPVIPMRFNAEAA